MIYTISVDLDSAGIEAQSEQEALSKARELIQAGAYSLMIVDTEQERG